MNDVDLATFQFDYDLTWSGLCLDYNGEAFARYGGRDAKRPEGRVSLEGLKYTLRLALAYYQGHPSAAHSTSREPQIPSDLFTLKGKGCLHCHQVWEGLRRQARADGHFDPDSLFVYPLPENVGLVLDVDEGNRVLRVLEGSTAEQAGIEDGDFVEQLGQRPVFSQADVISALHNSPPQGTLELQYRRGGVSHVTTLQLAVGWKKTDLSWRPSMRKEKKVKK